MPKVGGWSHMPRLNSSSICKSFIVYIIFAGAIWPAQAFRVVIDPGHGGSDHGAKYGRVTEANLALDVALRTARYLKGKNVEVFLTRKEDVTLGLQDRIDWVRKTNSQIFLSIHANSAPDRRAQGLELYFENHLPPEDDLLLLAAREVSAKPSQLQGDVSECRAADTILSDLRREGRLRSSRGLAAGLRLALKQAKFRQAPFFVLANNPTAALLVELGYLSNPYDLKRLSDEKVLQELSEKMAEGILTYQKNSQSQNALDKRGSPSQSF